MKVLEFEAKALLREVGLRVPNGQWVTSAQGAAGAAREIGGPVVVKAQIPTGGRMKAGGVKFAATPEEAQAMAVELLGLTIKGFPVPALLVEENVPHTAEMFVSLTYDSEARSAVLLASAAGGIEIEAEARLIRRLVPTLTMASDYVGREVASDLGLEGVAFASFSAAVARLLRAFAEWDALLLEVNPLVLDTSGRWWCVADVHLELDDDAAHRQAALLAKLPESRAATDRRTDFERKAAEIDSADHRGVAGRLVPFPGNLGLLIGGGGASLTIMDAVLEAGLKPANYCEIGGNPSVWKIEELTKLILSQPGVNRLAVIMNVVSNTRADLVARGVIKGALELGLEPREVITAFRIPGSWETEGQDLLRHYGIAFYGRETSIDQVVEADAVSILAGAETRILVQGITGREAATFTLESLRYGAKIVAGVTPGKGGQQAAGGVPVFDTVAQALRAQPCEASIISVPAPFVRDAAMEALANELKLLVIVTERVARRDVVAVLEQARAVGARVVGPNSLGVISPELTRIGMCGGSADAVRRAYQPGPVGVMSRSGGMLTEIASLLSQDGLGQSTCVSIGGDAIVGSAFLDLLPLYEADPQTRALVCFCEPGGTLEERLAEHLSKTPSRLPLVAFVAGRFTDHIQGQRFGHAGAIVEGSQGSPASKIAALRGAGVRVADKLSQIPRLVREAIGGD